MINLLDLLQQNIGPTLTRDAGKYLGEPEGAMKTAVSSLLPAVLAGCLKQGSTIDGAGQLLGLLKGPQVDAGLAGQLGKFLGAGGAPLDGLLRTGNSLVSALFGNRSNAIASALGSLSGIKTSSATSLLALAVPSVLSLLKGQVMTGGMDARGLMNMLLGQKEFMRGHLDDRLTAAMGLGPAASLLGMGGAAAGAASAAGGGLRRWLPWLLGIALLLMLLPRIRSCGREAQVGVEKAAQQTAEMTQKALRKLSLPDGATIDVPEGGFIAKLVDFIQNPASDLSVGLPFDDLNFETDSITISASSKSQLDELAHVLKAYPAVNVRVEGHTDNVGDSAANLQLSSARAAAVKARLVDAAVAPERIEAVGYGQDHPIADNATEPGRAQNRRVELYVTKR